MRSVKCAKHSHGAHCLRNRNARKRKAVKKAKAEIERWIVSTVEGKQCQVVQQLSVSVKREQPPKAVPSSTTEKLPTKKTEQKKMQQPEPKKTVQKEKKAEQKEKPKEAKKVEQKTEAVPPPKPKTEVKKKAVDIKKKKEPQKPKANDIAPSAKKSITEEPVKEIKAQSTSSAPKEDRLVEELSVEVDRSSVVSDSKMISSVDSGVSCRSSKSGSNESINKTGGESSTPTPQDNGTSLITKFAHNVLEFVNHAQKKLEEVCTKNNTESNFLWQEEKKVAAVANERKTSATQPIKPVELPKREPRKTRERVYKLLPKDIEFCTYMMETYQDNYEGMSKDAKNIFSDDAKALARKIRIFRESPHYQEYLASKSS
jgi:hypothetical protein